MPISYWIEKERRLVRIVVSGDFTLDDIFTTIQGATRDVKFEPGYDVLSDHTNVGNPLTSNQAKQISTYLENFRKVLAHSRMAVVTKKEASFGMMRMLSVLLERIPMELMVFRTMEEAERWLSRPKKHIHNE